MKPAYAFTVLRAALGAMWIAHALLKIFVFTLAGTAGFFAAHGFPAFLAGPVAAAELVGGMLIVLGWHGRLVSAALAPILLGALLVHVPNGWVFTAAGGGWEYPAFLVAASVVHAIGGDGAFALASARGPA
jgi:putative oxidoreductase